MSAHPTLSITYDHHSSKSRGVIYDLNIFIMQTIACKILPGTNSLAFLLFVENEGKKFCKFDFDHRKMLLGSVLQVIEEPGNTKGGSITVPLTSCLNGLD
jgi:hypothetical protein